MAAFNKFNSFVLELGKGTHVLGTHALKIAFTNTAPVATNTILGNITQITAAGGYVAGGFAVNGTTGTWAASGTGATLTITDTVFTATGAVNPFRYVVLYNDTPTSPVDPLIGWYDYGSSITLANTETFTVDFDGTNGVFSLT